MSAGPERVYSPAMRTRVDSWLRWRDVALAVGLAAVGAVEVALSPAIAPKGAAYPCEIALGLVLLARRLLPLLTAVSVGVIGMVESLAGVPMDAPWVPLAAMMAAVYTLSLLASLERAVTAIALMVTAFSVAAIDQHKGIGNVLFGIAFVVPIFLAGRGIRLRTEHAELLRQEQEEQARAAVEAERRRIARDLHDVISHSLGVVVLQAGAAEQVLDRDPARARELLGEIRATGHQAVGEFGALLALTRNAPVDSLEPSPSLDDVDRLADTMARAGLAVTVERCGVRRALPSAIDVSAYRIVQEALTNAAKHSGAGSAVVTLRYDPTELAIEVADDGPGRPGAPGTGSGLLGMRERAALFGGTVEAGRSADGGWHVEARLPVPR